MRNLYLLELPDLLWIVGGIAAGNAITLLLSIALGVSDVPPGMDVAGIVAAYLAVVVGFTLLPAAAVLTIAYASFRTNY